MQSKSMSKLHPPWMDRKETKAWYIRRPPENSLLSLTQGSLQPSKESKMCIDHRLKNWEKWLKTRKIQHKQLKSKSGRDPCNLTMNSEQYVRSIQEKRELIAYAQELIIPDKVRGGLDYWGFPIEVGRECSGEGLNLLSQQSNIHKGLLPNITNTGIPKLIKKEKGIPDRKTTKSSFENSTYKSDREKMLKKKINIILPHKPEIDDLIIVGTKPILPEPELFVIAPVITLNADEGFGNEFKETQEENIIALRFDKTLFLQESPGKVATHLRYLQAETYNENKNSWSLNFVAQSNEMITKTITFENMGTVAIQYGWRNIDMSVSFMKERINMPVFFFDKTEGVIIPGQTKTLTIWYKTGGPQIDKESWHFYTYPNIAGENIKIRINLEGISLEKSHGVENIESYIERRTALNVVEDILFYVLSTFNTADITLVSYKCLQREERRFTLKNPMYFYHQFGVRRLKELYGKLLLENLEMIELPWDMSIKTIRNLIIQMQPQVQTELFLELQEILILLQKPNIQIGFDNKYIIVNNLLVKFFNIFENEYEKSKKIVNASIMAINLTHVGNDLSNYIPTVTENISRYSDFRNNEISHRLFGPRQSQLNFIIFQRRILRQFQITIENIDACISMETKCNK